MAHYHYRIGQTVWLKAQGMALEIFALGTAKDTNVPVYFVRTPGDGAAWAMYEHEIEAYDGHPR